jgi:hypothetical protein
LWINAPVNESPSRQSEILGNENGNENENDQLVQTLNPKQIAPLRAETNTKNDSDNENENDNNKRTQKGVYIQTFDSLGFQAYLPEYVSLFFIPSNFSFCDCLHQAGIYFAMAITTDLYEYSPSVGAAIFFSILFGIITLINTYQLVLTRTWFFIPFLVGGYCEYHPNLQIQPLCTRSSTGTFRLVLTKNFFS